MIEHQKTPDHQTRRDAKLSKRARLKWRPRTRQPARPVTIHKTQPQYGPALYDHAELHARIVNGKAY